MQLDDSNTSAHPLSLLDDEFVWRGKYDETGQRRGVRPLPPAARLVKIERHGKADDAQNLLVHGDNLAALQLLRDRLRGRVTLAYLDPPFDVGTCWPMRVQLGNATDADGRRRDSVELPAYDDRWSAGAGWCHMLWQRLVLVRELLSDDGTIYVHCDWRTSHKVRALLDDVFGSAQFGNQLAWCYTPPGRSASRFKPSHDVLLRYGNGPNPVWSRPQTPLAAATLDVQSLRFGGQSETWTRTRDTRDMGDWWTIPFPTGSGERTGYPTQKPIALLDRVIEASSRPGDLVLDAFAGSGTTAIAALRSERRFIALDAGLLATRVTAARLDAEPTAQQQGWQLLAVDTGDDGVETSANASLVFDTHDAADGMTTVTLRDWRPDAAATATGLSATDAQRIRDHSTSDPFDLLERWIVGTRQQPRSPIDVLASAARGRRRRHLHVELRVELPAGATLAVEGVDVRGQRVVGLPLVSCRPRC